MSSRNSSTANKFKPRLKKQQPSKLIDSTPLTAPPPATGTTTTTKENDHPSASAHDAAKKPPPSGSTSKITTAPPPSSSLTVVPTPADASQDDVDSSQLVPRTAVIPSSSAFAPRDPSTFSPSRPSPLPSSSIAPASSFLPAPGGPKKTTPALPAHLRPAPRPTSTPSNNIANAPPAASSSSSSARVIPIARGFTPAGSAPVASGSGSGPRRAARVVEAADEALMDVPEGQQEDEAEEEEAVVNGKGKGKAKPKAKATTTTTKKRKAPSPAVKKVPAVRAKRVPAMAKKNAANKKKTNEDEEGDETDEEERRDMKVKRRKPIGRAKATKSDLLMRELDDDDDDAMEVDDADGTGEGAEEEEEEEEEEEGDDAAAAAPKPKAAKRIRVRKSRAKPLAVVDPGKTTMFELAMPGDRFEGRTSTRFEADVAKNLDRKALRKKKNEVMRERKRRREAGEPELSEEEVVVDDVAAEENRVAEEVRKKQEAQDRAAKELAVQQAQYAANAEGAEDDEEGERAPRAKKVNEDGDEIDSDEEDEDDEGNVFIESQYAPQMRIVNGEMVLDAASLEIDRSKDARVGHVGAREVIEESASDRFVNSATWGKKKRTEKWSDDETERFFDLLRQFGTDFETIARMFPTRTRAQIKAKYQKEDKIDTNRVGEALDDRKPIDLDAYAKTTGIDLSGPTPDDPYEKIQKLREKVELEARLAGPSIYGKPVEKEPAAETEEEREEREQEEELAEIEALREAAEEAQEKIDALMALTRR